jgi:3-oxoacyl-[acyl-carrier protein] reductase
MTKLTGKIAIVTGASKGIGAGIAKALAAAGASVAVNYSSDGEGANRVVAEIRDAGGKAIAIQAHVAKAADVKRLFDETEKALGRPNILVNNAGVFKFAPIEEFDENEFHRQFDTNVLGVLLGAREAAKRFASGDSVINIGSVAAHRLPPASSTYSATKAAVDAITGVLAKELGPRGIRVNAIAPGPVATEGFRTVGFAGSDFEKQAVAQTPLGRVGTPQDIASVAVFLASVESGWLTGQIIEAAGGMH